MVHSEYDSVLQIVGKIEKGRSLLLALRVTMTVLDRDSRRNKEGRSSILVQSAPQKMIFEFCGSGL